FSRFIEVNDALCNTLGYTREQLLSRSPADVSHPDDKLKALPLIDEAWESGQDFITLEKRFLHQSGRTIHALVALQLVRDSGKSSHLIGMVLDITDRKQYEERLKRKSSQLKQSNESLKEFAYAASHDLKQPLRTISSFTQLMLRYLPKEGTKPEVFEFAGHISEGVKRMETLINGLLEYSRVGNSQMNFETTNVVDVIITVCKNLGQQIQENKAEIDVVYPVPALAIDPLKFTSLLQNLISNAIKYRRPEVTPLIRLEAKEQEDHWLFSVQDNGKGIPEDQTENVFGLYKRLDTERETEGTGIGLSLCRRIVSRHGGEIWIKSEYGKGSTFYFTISKHIGEMVNNTTPEEVL
ncbi:MAG: PAS domain S-box protein, partial [Bacteroidetes bacterium]